MNRVFNPANASAILTPVGGSPYVLTGLAGEEPITNEALAESNFSIQYGFNRNQFSFLQDLNDSVRITIKIIKGHTDNKYIANLHNSNSRFAFRWSSVFTDPEGDAKEYFTLAKCAFEKFFMSDMTVNKDEVSYMLIGGGLQSNFVDV